MDFDATLFVGNLPFTINEEDLREFVSKEATKSILNVRIIRDKGTHLGKGIAYVQLTDKGQMRIALEKLSGAKFQGRDLRVKKAVPKERLEKKQRGKEQKLALR